MCVGHTNPSSQIASFTPNPMGGSGRVSRNPYATAGYSPVTTFNGRQVVPRQGSAGASPSTQAPGRASPTSNDGGIFGGLLSNLFGSGGPLGSLFGGGQNGQGGGLGGLFSGILGAIGNMFPGGIGGMLSSFFQGGISAIFQNLFNPGGQQQQGGQQGGGGGILGGIMQLIGGLFH